MACPVIDPDTGASLEYRHLIQGPDREVWVKSLANYFCIHAKRVCTRMPTGNENLSFVHPSVIPTHKKVTYGRLVVDIRPLKDEKFRVRLTVGSYKMDFCGYASLVAASLSTEKLLLNSVVSTKNNNAETKIYVCSTGMTDFKLSLLIIYNIKVSNKLYLNPLCEISYQVRARYGSVYNDYVI